MYALIQTYPNAERRTKEKSILFAKLFEATAGGPTIDKVDIESLAIVLKKSLDYLSDDLCRVLI